MSRTTTTTRTNIPHMHTTHMRTPPRMLGRSRHRKARSPAPQAACSRNTALRGRATRARFMRAVLFVVVGVACLSRDDRFVGAHARAERREPPRSGGPVVLVVRVVRLSVCVASVCSRRVALMGAIAIALCKLARVKFIVQTLRTPQRQPLPLPLLPTPTMTTTRLSKYTTVMLRTRMCASCWHALHSSPYAVE